MGSIIKAIEYIFPERQITNGDLQDRYPDYDFDKFEEKVGIQNRYWVNDDETALDLAIRACEKLFLKINKEEIDFILLCTQSPEYLLPTTACILQSRLNLSKNVGSLDFNLGCSGYVYGLSLAKGLIESGQCKNVLLVTSETYSKYLNEDDRSNRAIFGDAATASLITKSDTEGLKKFLFGTDGGGAESLIIKNGGARFPHENNAELKSYGSNNCYSDNDLYMNGPDIFNFTATNIPSFTKKLAETNEIELNDLDFVVFHQANAFMLELLRKKIKVDILKFIIDLEDGGNTVSNTIPIALKKLSEKNDFSTPKHIAIVGFGVGLSWAGGIIEIGNI